MENTSSNSENPSNNLFKKITSNYQAIINKFKNEKALGWLILANLNIFGLGYFLSKKKIRGSIYLAINLILLLVAHFTRASYHIPIWIGIFIVVFIAGALDLLFCNLKKSVQLQKFLGKSHVFIPVLAILINVIFYGGFFFYRQSGVTLYQNGLEAYEEAGFQTAFSNWYALDTYYQLSLNEDIVTMQDSLDEVSYLISSQHYVEVGEFDKAFETIDSFNDRFPNSKFEPQVNTIGLDSYIGFAHNLMVDEQYANSLDTLEEGALIYADEAFSREKEIADLKISLFMDWGQFLYESEEYESALQKFTYITTNYPDSSVCSEANESSAAALFDWANDFAEEESFEFSARALEEIINDYGDTGVIEAATQQLPETYLGWGKDLAKGHEYIQALITFEQIKDLTSIKSLIEEAEEEHAATILLLADDTGDDGKAVIEKAKESACDGEIPDDPSVDIFMDEPGKIVGCNSKANKYIPATLKANKPGTFRYIAEVENDSKRIQTCNYTGGHTLYREQPYTIVTIKSVLTGEVYKTKTFNGSAPSSCPNQLEFYSSTRTFTGDYADSEIISSWIEEVIQ